MGDTGNNLESHFNAIGRYGHDPKGGWTRLGYTLEEDEAHSYAAAQLIEAGFSVRLDPFLNLVASKGHSSKRVMIGTHLDTVRQGGNFDGVTGFAAGIEAVKSIPYKFGIDFVIFRAEESVRFNKACIGSSGAASTDFTYQKAAEQKCTITGNTLYNIVAERGGKPEYFGNPWINPADYLAYFEVHIEQASVLESHEKSLGIVTSIRAPVRYEIQLRGPGSGTACVFMVNALEILGNEGYAAGKDIVTTTGKVDCQDIKVEPNSPNTIAGKVSFITQYDLREILDKVCPLSKVRYEVKPIAGGYEFCIIGQQNHSGGTPMNERQDANAVLARALTEFTLANPSFRFGNYSKSVVDIRSNDRKTRTAIANEAIIQFSNIAKNMGLEITITPTEDSEPAPSLDKNLQAMLKASADELGIGNLFLPSGAGHDALKICQIGVPTAMLFVPSKNGRSHCLQESTDLIHILNATYVLQRTLGRFN
jgi:acetylornithine deacetylase/succinyl-diaminopimelate desuccinylase-like protein